MRVLGVAGTRGKVTWSSRLTWAGKAAVAIGVALRQCMTRRPGRDGQGYVMTRCRRGGTQAAMPRCTLRGGKSALTRHLWVPGAGPVVVHRPLRGGGSLMTRCAQGGTQTVLTRRPRRNGEGYVSTRCP